MQCKGLEHDTGTGVRVKSPPDNARPRENTRRDAQHLRGKLTAKSRRRCRSRTADKLELREQPEREEPLGRRVWPCALLTNCHLSPLVESVSVTTPLH